MELTTKQKGDITELKCLTYFYEQGYSVSIPWGENDRYDMILDIGGILLRLQAKTSREGNYPGTFVFSTATTHKNRVKVEREGYTKDDIDYFVTLYRNKCYLVSCLETETASSKVLRYAVNNRSNSSISNWASNYEADKIISKIKETGEKDIIVDNSTVPEDIPTIEEFYYSDKQIEKFSKNKKNSCVDCGKDIGKNSIRCKECENLHRVQPLPISRKDLKDKIRNSSFCSIGNEYQVSDNAVRKWCIRYGLPSTKREINKISEEDWLNI